MTQKALLTAYREATIELEELQRQTDQAAADLRTAQHNNLPPDTCTPFLQIASGLEALLEKKKGEHAILQAQVDSLLADIHDFRTYLVLHHYYRLGRTDEQVARAMSISRGRANQLRLEYLESAHSAHI